MIGWYKFRCHTSDNPTIRERAIHRHLKDYFPGIRAQDFVFSLFTSTAAQNFATHNFDYKFLVQPARFVGT